MINPIEIEKIKERITKLEIIEANRKTLTTSDVIHWVLIILIWVWFFFILQS